MQLNYKLFVLALTVLFMAFQSTDAYSLRINCDDGMDVQEYPICEYVSEWNESEEFNEKVFAELALRADEINEDPRSASQIYQETLNKVNRDNPGLQEKCQKLKDWVYAQIQR